MSFRLFHEFRCNRERTHEAQQVQRRTNCCDIEGAGVGLQTGDLCRKHGISSATFYKLKVKHGSLEVSDARRLKRLEDENTTLC